ncbi:MAG TPA: hypothetical protein VLD37_02975 [Candidatus Bilamarchaeum sp.]|nr:hypothetical protein [Candidatus Bilamarchaeum sp.]
MAIFSFLRSNERRKYRSGSTLNGRQPLAEGLSEDSLRQLRDMFARNESDKIDALISAQPETLKYVEQLITDEYVSRDATWKLVEHNARGNDWAKIDTLLRHTDTRIRSCSAWALSALAEKGHSIRTATPSLEWGLSDRRGDVKQNAAKALISDAANSGTESLEAIERALASPKDYVRENMVQMLSEALSVIRTRDVSLRLLGKAMASEFGDVRAYSVGAVSEASEKGIDITLVVGALAQRLSKDNPVEIRRDASWALGNAAVNRTDLSAVADVVGAAILDRDLTVRMNSSWALMSAAERKGDVGGAVDGLTAGLSDKNEIIRLNCAKALVNAASDPKKGEKAVSALSGVLMDRKSKERAKEMASWALIYAVEMECDITPAIGALSHTLIHGSKILKLNSSYALLGAAELGLSMEGAVQALSHALSDKSQLIRLNAISALMHAGLKGNGITGALESIRNAGMDENPEIRWRAMETVRIIESR